VKWRRKYPDSTAPFKARIQNIVTIVAEQKGILKRHILTEEKLDDIRSA
jgi:hypothetical protein